ncbi:LLM class flavin-dependent oxidoreductase [Streptomyces sp. NPDC002680]|uniref:LLM class flavin-dependent oxidoreductase n=1 Tax=Streptomyces sp. NPDC002680 TaxID=3364659 RepID=UPI0036CC06D9
MKFLLNDIVANTPDAATGHRPTQRDRLRSVVERAVHAEELGIDAVSVGERHGGYFLSSSPAVLLSAIGERTSRVRLLTGVTVLSILDPVRVAEEFATLDNLSDGRVELIVSKGNHPDQYSLFGLDESLQWDYLAEKYELLRRLWEPEPVTWSGRFRTPLTGVTTQPRPLQRRITVWHGSATSERSTDLAARHGDPLFTANGFHRRARYARLVDHYRERWAHYGRAPEDAVVAASFPSLLVADTSQKALELFRPVWEAFAASPTFKHNKSEITTVEEFVGEGSALVGSPAQIIDKLGEYHELFGHELTGISVEHTPAGLKEETLERFAAEVAPAIRAGQSSRVWAD